MFLALGTRERVSVHVYAIQIVLFCEAQRDSRLRRRRGDNPMGANYSPTCRTGETSCPGEVEAIFDVERTDPCVYSGNACLTTQPTRHVKTLTNGAVTFSDVAFRLPKSTRQGGATTLTFRAPGLVDVTIAFDVWPGDASSLEVVVPSAFDGSLDGVGLKSSTTPSAGVSNPFLVYVRDDAGNRLHDEDTSTRTVTVAVVDDTAVLQGDLTATATDGACAFSNLFLGSPPGRARPQIFISGSHRRHRRRQNRRGTPGIARARRDARDDDEIRDVDDHRVE